MRAARPRGRLQHAFEIGGLHEAAERIGFECQPIVHRYSQKP